MLLINAVKCGRTKQVKLLLKVGIDVNVVDENGQSGLIHSSFLQDSRLRLAVLKPLVAWGGNLNKRDNFGRTVFSWACLLGRVEMVRFLLNDPRCMDLRIDLTDKDGNSTLLLSVMSGNLSVVKMTLEVLKGGLSVTELNKANNAGMRPLIAAFMRGDKLCAQLLIKQASSSVANVLKYLKSLQNGSVNYCSSVSPLFDSSLAHFHVGDQQANKPVAQFTEDDILRFLFKKDKHSLTLECASQEFKEKESSAEQPRVQSSLSRSDSRKHESFRRRPATAEIMFDRSEGNNGKDADSKTVVSVASETPTLAGNKVRNDTTSRALVQKLMVLYADQHSSSFREGLPICRYTPPPPPQVRKQSSCVSVESPQKFHGFLGESLMDQQLRMKYSRSARAASMQVAKLPPLSGLGRGRMKRTKSVLG